MDVAVSRRNSRYCDRIFLNYSNRVQGNLCTVGICAEVRSLKLLNAMQKQYRSSRRAGIERNNRKRTVIEVPKFRNSWLGARGIAGCIISLIQFLSLHDDDFSKRKSFGPCIRCLGFQTIYFLFIGKKKLSYYSGRRI